MSHSGLDTSSLEEHPHATRLGVLEAGTHREVQALRQRKGADGAPKVELRVGDTLDLRSLEGVLRQQRACANGSCTTQIDVQRHSSSIKTSHGLAPLMPSNLCHQRLGATLKLHQCVCATFKLTPSQKHSHCHNVLDTIQTRRAPLASVGVIATHTTCFVRSPSPACTGTSYTPEFENGAPKTPGKCQASVPAHPT